MNNEYEHEYNFFAKWIDIFLIKYDLNEYIYEWLWIFSHCLSLCTACPSKLPIS